MAIKAQLDIISEAQSKGRRGTPRRTLRLRARSAAGAGESSEVLVRNLSETGLLMQSAVDLQVGDKFEVDLPETPRSVVRVVWADDDLFGCAFDTPLKRSALSAAQLRSAPESSGAVDVPEEAWGQRLKRLRSARGYSLVEFARLMGVSRPTVWAWEAGKSTPRASKRDRLLEIVGASDWSLQSLALRCAGEASTPPSLHQVDDLRSVVEEAKQRVAAVAGIRPEKVKLIIEV